MGLCWGKFSLNSGLPYPISPHPQPHTYLCLHRNLSWFKNLKKLRNKAYNLFKIIENDNKSERKTPLYNRMNLQAKLNLGSVLLEVWSAWLLCPVDDVHGYFEKMKRMFCLLYVFMVFSRWWLWYFVFSTRSKRSSLHYKTPWEV